MIPCPCCKRPVREPTFEIVIDHCKLTPQQAIVLGAIWRGRGQPVQTEMILVAMDRGGNAKSHSYEDMKIVLHHVRKRLKNAGIEIPNCGYGRGYRLKFPSKGELHV